MKQPDISVVRFIDNYDSFLVAGHSDPDGDCICSSIVMASVLVRYGKKAIAYNEGPIIREDVKEFGKKMIFSLNNNWIETHPNCALIIVDCSSLERLGKESEKLEDLPTLVIDHHASGENFGDIRYIDSQSPSTTLLIQRVANALHVKLTEKEAQSLFFGFCTDTGFFKHLNKTAYQELCEVAELMKAGADPKTSYQQMTGGKKVENIKILGKLLEQSEFYHNNTIALVYNTSEDLETFGKEANNADSIYGQVFSVSGVQAVIFIKYKEPNYYGISFRALNAINVGELAKDLGGGGHKLASGVKLSGSFEEIKKLLLDKIVDQKYIL